MTRTSCIPHPEKEQLVIIRKWQIEFCAGNACAAALLSFYEYWHNIKIEMQQKNVKANDIAQMHHDELTSKQQDEIHGWINNNHALVKNLGEPDCVCEAIKSDMLNPQRFSKTGNDFHHKLNALIKAIRDGQWRPTQYLQQQNAQQSQLLQQLKHTIQKLEAERQQHQVMLSDPMRAKHHEFLQLCRKVIQHSDERLKPLYKQIQVLVKENHKIKPYEEPRNEQH